MELIIEAMRIVCPGINIFGNLKTLGRKVQATSRISSNSVMFKPCSQTSILTLQPQCRSFSVAKQEQSAGEGGPLGSEGTIWEPLRQAALEQQGSVVERQYLPHIKKNVLNDHLPTRMLLQCGFDTFAIKRCGFVSSLLIWHSGGSDIHRLLRLYSFCLVLQSHRPPCKKQATWDRLPRWASQCFLPPASSLCSLGVVLKPQTSWSGDKLSLL